MIARETHQAEILDGRGAASQIKGEVSAEVTALKSKHGVTPRLAAVLVGDDTASAVYVRNKIRACEEVGIASEHLPMPASTTDNNSFVVVAAGIGRCSDAIPTSSQARILLRT